MTESSTSKGPETGGAIKDTGFFIFQDSAANLTGNLFIPRLNSDGIQRKGAAFELLGVRV